MPETFHPQPAHTPTAVQVAEFLKGELREPDLAPGELTGVATLAEAGPTHISFAASVKTRAQAEASAAGLLLVGPDCDLPGRARIALPEVWPALARLLTWLYPLPQPPAGIHPTAVVDASAVVDPSATVGPYCVIAADAQVGPRSIIGPHCIVARGCTVGADTRFVARVTLVGLVHVGARVLIHPGAVLGADGFKFEATARGPLKIPQVGAVIIEDDVEIGANTCIDRAFLHATRLARGVKLDNLVQIGHNVSVGPMTLMAAQVGIAGSTTIGMGCMFGGQSAVADNATVGDRVMVAGQAGIMSHADSGSVVMGSPEMPLKQFLRSYAEFSKLPELSKRVRALEQQAAPPKL